VNRQTAKALNFGLLYGAGPRKLMWIAKEQYDVDLTEERATQLRNQWFAKYKGVAQYHRSVVEYARLNKGVRTHFGRWRPLPDILDRNYAAASHAERQAINTPIQSMASDITLAKLQELESDPGLHLAGIRPIATIHDSIV
jgi:DNA polymerase-1